jgi:hypothetical protein
MRQEYAGNTVKSIQMIGVRDGHGPCNRLGVSAVRYPCESRASEAAEFFTKRMVTNEK